MLSIHPIRSQIFEELHSRPSMEIDRPSILTSFVVHFDRDSGDQWNSLLKVISALGMTIPKIKSTFYFFRDGDISVQWSLHNEFARYTLVESFVNERLHQRTVLCAELEGCYGDILVVNEILVLSQQDYDSWTANETWLPKAGFIGGEIGNGRGRVFTDFRLHASPFVDAGTARYLVLDYKLGARSAGAMAQRLLEIDTYLSLALLSLPIAKLQMSELDDLGVALKELTSIAEEEMQRDVGLLHRLENLAAELERHIAACQYRFSASKAYYQLVLSRIDELEESKLLGVQSLKEFVHRRLVPAMMTCETVEKRHDKLALRIQRTTGLLRTRVEVVHEEQNRELLASMARRAEMQLRLQQTVEGLSVWVLTYYAAGLLAYCFKATQSLGVDLDVALAVGFAIPIITALFWWRVHANKARFNAQGLAAPTH